MRVPGRSGQRFCECGKLDAYPADNQARAKLSTRLIEGELLRCHALFHIPVLSPLDIEVAF